MQHSTASRARHCRRVAEQSVSIALLSEEGKGLESWVPLHAAAMRGATRLQLHLPSMRLDRIIRRRWLWREAWITEVFGILASLARALRVKETRCLEAPGRGGSPGLLLPHRLLIVVRQLLQSLSADGLLVRKNFLRARPNPDPTASARWPSSEWLRRREGPGGAIPCERRVFRRRCWLLPTFFRPKPAIRSHPSGRAASILLACGHTITGYSGNSICPYSFQIRN